MKRGRKAVPCKDTNALREAYAIDPRPFVIAERIGANVKQVRRWLGEIGIELAPPRKHRPHGVTPPFLGVARKPIGGRVSSRLYNSFDAMHKRCYSPSRWEYDKYGGRGIRVCAEWYHNFAAFRSWALANGYRKGMTIDRIDNNADYSPSNCRWATRAEQTYNRDACYRVTFNGETKLLHEWARELQIPIDVLRVRKRKGWPDEHVLTVPKGGRCPGFAYGKPGRRPRESYGYSSDPSTSQEQP